MRAIAVAKYGDQPRLVEIHLPDPGQGEVEVSLVAASRNPLDQLGAAGFLANLGLGSYRCPLVLGFDGAGVVSRVGAGAASVEVGDRVFGQFWSDPMQFGTYAEAAIVQAEPAFGALAHIPDGVDFATAAASPTAGMMALGAIDHSRAVPGDTVIILGAAGGVGTFAVQVAAARGIRVLASAADGLTDELRALGAADALPRDTAGLDAAVHGIKPDSVAAVLDFAGDRRATTIVAGAVRPDGTLLSTAYGIPDELRTDPRLRTVDYSLEGKPGRLRSLAALLAERTIRPVIGTEIDLDDVLDTLGSDRCGERLRGKTVIRIRRDPT